MPVARAPGPLETAIAVAPESERPRLRALAHANMANPPTSFETPEGLRFELRDRLFVPGRGLHVALASPNAAVDPDGYFFPNPPVKVPSDGGFIEDVSAAFREIVTDAARHYATHPEVWGRTTSTFFAAASDGWVGKDDATYATAANTATGSTAQDADTEYGFAIGQDISGGIYTCREMFFSFDTSSIPDVDTVTTSTFSLYGFADNSTTDFTLEVRPYNWGAAVGTDDYRTATQLGSLTLLATYATSGGWSTVAYNDFTSDAAFPSNVSKTGITYVVVNSNRHRTQTTPTNREMVGPYFADDAGTTRDPKLVVNHSSPEMAGAFRSRTLQQAVPRAASW